MCTPALEPVGPAPTAPPPETRDTVANEGLATSIMMFEDLKSKIGSHSDDHCVSIPVRELKRLRKGSVKLNRTLSKLNKLSRMNEHRLIMELQLLRQVMRRDCIDREANRARVFQKLRLYQETKTAAAATASSSNVGPGATPESTSVDRAIWSVAKTEEAVNALAPTSNKTIQGSSILFALNDDF